MKKKAANKPKLPKYVLLKFDPPQWFVRRNFPTLIRDKNGRVMYTQVVRRCLPETIEQANALAYQIEAEWNADKPNLVEPTIKDFVSSFVAAKESSVSRRTYDDYAAIYRRYVEGSAFANMPVADVSPLQVQNFYTSLATRGISGKMIRKLHTVLSMCFNQGLRWELVKRNPCKGVLLPRVDSTELEIMSPDDARKFARVCMSEPEFYVLAVALETGMRPGEYLALRWSDVSVKNHAIKVVRAVAFNRTSGFVYKSPKTAKSRRTLQISPSLAECLAKQKAIIAEKRLQLQKDIEKPVLLPHMRRKGRNYNIRRESKKHKKKRLETHIEHDLVFPSDAGTPMDPRNVARREMKTACEMAGIPSFTLYSLRHSSASLALAAGANLKVVSERLGHSDATQVLRVYQHVLPNMQKEATAQLSDILYGR